MNTTPTNLPPKTAPKSTTYLQVSPPAQDTQDRAKSSIYTQTLPEFTIELFNSNVFQETNISHKDHEKLQIYTTKLIQSTFLGTPISNYSPTANQSSPLGTATKRLHSNINATVERIKSKNLFPETSQANLQAQNLFKTYTIFEIFLKIAEAGNDTRNLNTKARALNQLIHFLTHQKTYILDQIKFPYIQNQIVDFITVLSQSDKLLPRKNLPVAIALLAGHPDITSENRILLWNTLKIVTQDIWLIDQPKFILSTHLETYYNNTINSLDEDLIPHFQKAFLRLVDNTIATEQSTTLSNLRLKIDDDLGSASIDSYSSGSEADAESHSTEES